MFVLSSGYDCRIYIDDCLFFGKRTKEIDAMIESLRSLRTDFDLEVEKDVSTYLRIKIIHHKDGRITMSQPYLVQRNLEATGMTRCNGKKTPAATDPIGKDPGETKGKTNGATLL